MATPLVQAGEPAPAAKTPIYVSEACGAPPKDLIKIGWMTGKPKWISRVQRPNHELIVHRWQEEGGTLDFLERTLVKAESGKPEWNESIGYEYNATTGRLLNVYTFEKAKRGVRVAYPVPRDLDLEKLRGKDGWITLSIETVQMSASASGKAGVKTVRFPAPSNLLQSECFGLTTGFQVPTVMPGPTVVKVPKTVPRQPSGTARIAPTIQGPPLPLPEGIFDEEAPATAGPDADGWNHADEGRWKVEDDSSDLGEVDPTP